MENQQVQQLGRKERRKLEAKRKRNKKLKNSTVITTTIVSAFSGFITLSSPLRSDAITTNSAKTLQQAEENHDVKKDDKGEFIKKVNKSITDTLKKEDKKTDLKKSEMIAYAIQRSNWGTESYADEPQNNLYALPMIENRTNFTFEAGIKNNGDVATYKNVNDGIIDFINLLESRPIEKDSDLQKEIDSIIKEYELKQYDNDIQHYIVQPNDTVSGIATKYGVTIDSILQENNLKNASFIYIGQDLKIKNGIYISDETETTEQNTNTDVQYDTPETNEPVINDTTPAQPEVEQNETPEYQEPVETPTETPTVEEPVQDETQPEQPVEETPVVEEQEPVAENPVTEQPVAETPTEQAPVVETPVENPVTETPVVETPTQVPVSNTSQGQAVVAEAAKHIGKPYVWGGKGPEVFDCSGLTSYVYRHATGKEIGGWTVPQEDSGTIISVNDAQPGDLYFWGAKGSTHHVAIATGGGQYIHAPQPGESVKYGSVLYYTPDFAVRVY